MSKREKIFGVMDAVLRLSPSTPAHTAVRITFDQLAPTEIFQYSLLKSSKHTIRLLHLQRGFLFTKIHCKFIQVSLEERPKYEALSYTWGEQHSGIGIITLNGSFFPITPSLHIALRHLRLPYADRILWIDALCINQLDDREKSVQIQMMRNIYCAASNVLVWLGPAAQGSDKAMDYIARLSKIDVNKAPEQLKDQGEEETWNALLQLFRRPWWTRSWVLQEVSAAELDPQLGCGYKWLPWSNFEVVFGSILKSTSKRALQTLPRTVGAFHHIRTRYRQPSSSSRIGLLLQTTLAFEASDSRDKVFSLLGLLHEAEGSILRPDYSLSVQQVYTRLAVYLIENDINTLCFNVNSSSYNLPSWVPDWSTVSYRWPLWMPNTYKASGLSRTNIQVVHDSRALKVTGVSLDYIRYVDTKSRTAISQPSESDSTEEEVVENIENVLHRALQQQQWSNPRLFNPRSSDALWRTLVTNREIVGNIFSVRPKTPAPTNFKRMFRVFRNRGSIPASFKSGMPASQRREEYTKPFLMSMQLGDQRFFITSKGHIGLGPHRLQESDMAVLLLGADMPFVLRDKGSHYQLIGPSYVHGVMDGEFWKSKTTDDIKRISVDFTLK